MRFSFVPSKMEMTSHFTPAGRLTAHMLLPSSSHHSADAAPGDDQPRITSVVPKTTYCIRVTILPSRQVAEQCLSQTPKFLDLWRAMSRLHQARNLLSCVFKRRPTCRLRFHPSNHTRKDTWHNQKSKRKPSSGQHSTTQPESKGVEIGRAHV